MMTLKHSNIIGALDPKKMLSLSAVVENSLMSLYLALGEVSPTILVWLCDGLGMLGGMDLMMYLFKESPLTMRIMLRVTVKGSCELGAWYIGMIARHCGTRIPSLLSLISNGYGPALKVL